MHWTALPKGGFTRIDWSQPGATAGFDPYLVWAEATDFESYGLPGPPKWLPLLVELAAGATIAQLKAFDPTRVGQSQRCRLAGDDRDALLRRE